LNETSAEKWKKMYRQLIDEEKKNNNKQGEVDLMYQKAKGFKTASEIKESLERLQVIKAIENLHTLASKLMEFI
jgi:hypothetical protein